jgi:hypothetical protein
MSASTDVVFAPDLVDPQALKKDGKCGIASFNFSPEIQVELKQFNLSQDGYVDSANVEIALCCLVNERRGRLALRAFGSRMKVHTELLDPDNDGFIDYAQIEEALVKHFTRKAGARYRTIFWTLFGITCFIFLCATFGLVYLVVDLHKDMSSMGNKLVSRATGEPLQTASADYTIQSGIFTQRTDGTKRRNALESADVKILPFSGAVATISSKLSMTQLSSLTSLVVTSDSGDTGFSIDILGFAVIPSPSGKYVIFQTGAGQILLNGTAMSPAPEQLGIDSFMTLPFPSKARTRGTLPAQPPFCASAHSILFILRPNHTHLHSCTPLARYSTASASASAPSSLPSRKQKGLSPVWV